MVNLIEKGPQGQGKKRPELGACSTDVARRLIAATLSPERYAALVDAAIADVERRPGMVAIYRACRDLRAAHNGVMPAITETEMPGRLSAVAVRIARFFIESWASDEEYAAIKAEAEALAEVEARALAKAQMDLLAKAKAAMEAAAEAQAFAGPVLARRWPARKRGIPSALLRCPIFAAVPRSKVVVRDGLLPAQAGLMRVGRGATGDQWVQADLSVLLELIQICDEVGRFNFGVDELLEALGITPGTDTRAALKAALHRLTGSIQIDSQVGGKTMTSVFALLSAFRWSTQKGRGRGSKCTGRLAPEFVLLFQVANVTHIDAAQRRALPAGLAQWFHAFYSSHRVPLPMKLSDLARWSGLAGIEQKAFNRGARKAFDAFVSVGFFVSYSISHGGVVSVVRAGSAEAAAESQAEGDEEEEGGPTA
jgi:hypothetical protein